MHDLLLSATTWWMGTAACGGLILLAASLMMRLTQEPALRQRLGELAVLAALAVAVLRLGPVWLSVPWPTSAAQAVCDPVVAREVPLLHSMSLSALPPVLQPPDGVTADLQPPMPTHDPKVVGVTTFRVAGFGRRILDSKAEDAIEVHDPEPALAMPEHEACEAVAVPSGWNWRLLVAGMTALYLGGVLLLASRWLLGQWALARLLRQGRPASARLRKLFTLMASGTHWPLPLLRLSRRLQLPVCFGLRRPAVVLPEIMEYTADETALRWVFAHELTHLKRRDPWSNWGIELAQVLYFYLPWFWWVRRQVRLCQEFIADAAAAREGEAADEYAAFLVSLAKRSATPLGATGLGSSSDLMRRVQMLLQSTTRVQASCSRRWSLVTAGGLFGVAVVLSGLGLRAEQPQKGDEPQKDVIILSKDAAQDVLKKIVVDQDGEKKVIVIKPEDLKDGHKFIIDGKQLVIDGKGLVIDGKEMNVLKLIPDDVLKFVPSEKNVIVSVLSDGQAKKQDGDTDGQDKKQQKMTIVIDIDGKKVTIPIDGDMDPEKIKAAIEKAMAATKKATEAGVKARELSQADREKAQVAREKAQAAAQAAREKAQAAREQAKAEAAREKAKVKADTAREKAKNSPRVQQLTDEQKAKLDKSMADMKNQIDAAEKALKGLQKDLGDDRFKDMMKKLEELKAKGAGDAARQANDAMRRLVEVQPRVAGAATLGGTIVRSAGGTRLGVQLEKPSAALADQLDLPRNQGMVITNVAKDSAAAKAGIKANDILLELDGKPVTSDTAAFARQVQGLKADEAVSAVVLRKGKKVRIRDLDVPEVKAPEGGTARRITPGQIEVKPGENKAFDFKFTPDVFAVPATPKIPTPPRAPTPPKVAAAPKTPATPKLPATPKPPARTDADEKGSSRSVSVEVNDGQLKATMKEDGVTITVTGKVTDGNVEVTNITIQDGGNRNTYRSLDRVPAKFRDKVKKLISNTTEPSVQSEFMSADLYNGLYGFDPSSGVVPPPLPTVPATPPVPVIDIVPVPPVTPVVGG